MSRRHVTVCVAGMLVLLFPLLPVSGPGQIAGLETLPVSGTSQSPLTQSELETVRSGTVLVHLPAVNIGHEVVGYGAVRVDVGTDYFLERFRDIETFKRSSLTQQIGTFSAPPRIEDLKNLTLENEDLEDLRRGRVGNCGVKLDGASIRRFQTDIDWRKADFRQRANQLMREILLDGITRYLAEGNAGLGVYRDKSYPLSLGGEFESILSQPDRFWPFAPELSAWLMAFPNLRPQNGEGFLYWSKERIGQKVVISVTQVLMVKKRIHGRSGAVIATKQLYASHYFEGSLGLLVFLEGDPLEPIRTGYLIHLNRSRSDVLRGRMVGLKRALIGGKLREGIRKNLLETKQKLETGYRAANAGRDGTILKMTTRSPVIPDRPPADPKPDPQVRAGEEMTIRRVRTWSCATRISSYCRLTTA